MAINGTLHIIYWLDLLESNICVCIFCGRAAVDGGAVLDQFGGGYINAQVTQILDMF